MKTSVRVHAHLMYSVGKLTHSLPLAIQVSGIRVLRLRMPVAYASAVCNMPAILQHRDTEQSETNTAVAGPAWGSIDVKSVADTLHRLPRDLVNTNELMSSHHSAVSSPSSMHQQVDTVLWQVGCDTLLPPCQVKVISGLVNQHCLLVLPNSQEDVGRHVE